MESTLTCLSHWPWILLRIARPDDVANPMPPAPTPCDDVSDMGSGKESASHCEPSNAAISNRWIVDVALWAGVVGAVVTIVAVIVVGAGLAWPLAVAASLGLAAIAWFKRPDHPLAGWFVLLTALPAIEGVPTGILPDLIESGAEPVLIAGVTLIARVLSVVALIASARVIALFPDGVYRRNWERRLMLAFWSLLFVPLVLLVASPDVPVLSDELTSPAANPLHIPAFTLDPGTAVSITRIAGLAWIAAVVMLFTRYQRMDAIDRKRTRWLFVPVLAGGSIAVADLVADLPEGVAFVVFRLVIVLTAAAVLAGLLGTMKVDIDVLLRRWLLYGALWLAVALVYGGLSAWLGTAVAERASVGWAVTLTVVAMLALQPVRGRLERSADRWVFGVKPDSVEVIRELGAILANTYEQESLLTNMESALVDGLGLEWARVTLTLEEPGESEPVLLVRITIADKVVGLIACGPKKRGRLTDADVSVVETFAGQAALAVSNLRLTSDLADKAAELGASRARIIRAGEAERRRIERNIHDGVQQHLVALIAQAGRARSHTTNDPVAAEELASLQVGMESLLGELRELASGIHPSLLRDRGLLTAVESLAARNPLPVAVRADPSLRDLRIAEEIESACYYTVAESLANILKHSRATLAEITLSRDNGCLEVRIDDDGVGFDPGATSGTGLGNLSERLSALGGHLTVTGRPGHGTTVSAKVVLQRPGLDE